LLRNLSLKSKIEIDIATLRELKREYKKKAKKKGLSYELSEKQFFDLVLSNCFYCGSKPSNEKGYRSNRSIKTKHQGIDRVVNEKGYTKENTVPCCWKCNQWKKAGSVDEFIAHIEKLSLRLEGLKKWTMEPK
jgi:hypothetical protein